MSCNRYWRWARRALACSVILGLVFGTFALGSSEKIEKRRKSRVADPYFNIPSKKLHKNRLHEAIFENDLEELKQLLAPFEEKMKKFTEKKGPWFGIGSQKETFAQVTLDDVVLIREGGSSIGMYACDERLAINEYLTGLGMRYRNQDETTQKMLDRLCIQTLRHLEPQMDDRTLAYAVEHWERPNKMFEKDREYETYKQMGDFLVGVLDRRCAADANSHCCLVNEEFSAMVAGLPQEREEALAKKQAAEEKKAQEIADNIAAWHEFTRLYEEAFYYWDHGPAKTKSFTINGEDWVLEWEAKLVVDKALPLLIQVLTKDGFLVREIHEIGSTEGKIKLKGPGTFYINIKTTEDRYCTLKAYSRRLEPLPK